MASENVQVVGDITCNPRYVGLVKPEKQLPNTKFLMDFNIKIRCPESITEMDPIRLELEYNPHSMWVAINKELLGRGIPRQVRAAIEDPILKETRVARADTSFDARKYLHMKVDIAFCLGFFDGIGEYEPSFVPASEVSIKELEKTRLVEGTSSLEKCTVCMEEMMPGSEATRMPCLHVYHWTCIVEWLRKSGVCPCCKFRMPTDTDDE